MIDVALDEDGCLNLMAILRVMNQISQEQAWALAYELARLVQRLWPAGNNCAVIESLAQIYIHHEGYIHEKSLWSKISCPLAEMGPAQLAGQEEEEEEEEEATSSDENCKSPPKTTTTTTITHTNTITTSFVSNATGRPEVGAASESQTKTSHHRQECPESRKQQLQENTNQTNLNNNNNNINSHHRQRNNDLSSGDSNKQQQQQAVFISPELSDEILARRVASTEAEFVSSLGTALYWALDHGIAEDRERKLQHELELLIARSLNKLSLAELEQMCAERLQRHAHQHLHHHQQQQQSPAKVELHYRQVCKSLVQDTIKLSIFLHKIYTASVALSNVEGHHRHHHHDHHQSLEQLEEAFISGVGAHGSHPQINDWARLWMQVIRELRQRGFSRDLVKFTAVSNPVAATTTTTSTD